MAPHESASMIRTPLMATTRSSTTIPLTAAGEFAFTWVTVTAPVAVASASKPGFTGRVTSQ